MFCEEFTLNSLGEDKYIKSSRIIPIDLKNQKENNNGQNKNIFASSSPMQLSKDIFEKSYKRLNDMDSKILDKSLVQYIPSDSLRLELKIQAAEGSLKSIRKEIRDTKILGLDKDKDRMLRLELQKLHTKKEIASYRSEYRKLGLVFKVADIFSEINNKNMEMISTMGNYFIHNPIVRKIKNSIPILKKRDEMKQIIEKINTVNSKARTTYMSKSTPFGESKNNFKELVHIISEANKVDIQSGKFLTLTQKTVKKAPVSNPIMRRQQIRRALVQTQPLWQNKIR